MGLPVTKFISIAVFCVFQKSYLPFALKVRMILIGRWKGWYSTEANTDPKVRSRERVNCKSKEGKANPLQAWTGPKGSRRLRLPDFKTVST